MTAIKKQHLFDGLVILLMAGMLCGISYLGYQVSARSKEKERIKQDYSVAHSITFGIFSVDQWREKISLIVDGKIDDFNVTAEQKKEFQAKVEKQLHRLINTAIAEINKPQKSIGGKLKKLAFKAFVDVDEIHDLVPTFAATIVNKVNSPKSEKRLKNIVSSKVDQLEKQTFDNTIPASATVIKNVYAKYQVANAAAFEETINGQIAAMRRQINNYTWAMFACLFFAVCTCFLYRKQRRLQTTLYIFSLLIAFVFLMTGVTATIIEVDARIQSLNFTLLGEKLSFSNQVLFFQSKSIGGIVQSLVAQPKPDAVLVGYLILLFVIILPVLRLIGKGIHTWGRDKYADNKMIRFLAFDLGKWDMADVMVVGIAMTYIGLNGILESQLSNLNIQEELLSTTTQNNTSLQAGYFIFVGYVAYTVILSAFLKKEARHAGTRVTNKQ